MNGEQIAVDAIKALNALGVAYMVTGSFASNTYGIPRSTKDIDFVVESEDTLGAGLARALGHDYILDPQIYWETITSTVRQVITHRDSSFKIEVFQLSADEHDRQRFERRRPIQIEGAETFVPTAEDVIITKLHWSRRGARPKDIQDARNVMAVQSAQLDWPYIQSWCDRHGTRGLLDDIRRQIEQA